MKRIACLLLISMLIFSTSISCKEKQSVRREVEKNNVKKGKKNTIKPMKKTSEKSEELKRFPLNDTKGILTKNGVSFDKTTSKDGKGSLKLVATKETVFKLFKLTGFSLDNAKLLYKAQLKCKDVKGKAYLEMWVVTPDNKRFFSKGLNAPLEGTIDWTTKEIPFFLKKGEKINKIEINLVIKGTGTVWIDDIIITKNPLN